MVNNRDNCSLDIWLDSSTGVLMGFSIHDKYTCRNCNTSMSTYEEVEGYEDDYLEIVCENKDCPNPSRVLIYD